MMLTLGFCIILFSIVLSQFGLPKCVVRLDLPNQLGDVRFNLSPYMLDGNDNELNYYCVKDEGWQDPFVDRDYTYCFNVCDNVLSYPISESWNSSYCQDLNNYDDRGFCPQDSIDTISGNCTSGVVPIKGTVYAYQLKNSNSAKASDNCWRLSGKSGGPPEWSFYDEEDPTAGVVIKYQNGDYSPTGCKKNRELELKFKCANSRLRIPKIEKVSEDTCTYTIEFESIYGCPEACNGGCSEVCNAQGVCGFDFNNGVSKCFCYSGFTGPNCDERDSSSAVPSKKQHPDNNNPAVKTFNDRVSYTQSNGDEAWANVDITFDLTPFRLTNPNSKYLLEDTRNNTYQYFFNVAQKVTNIPPACKTGLSPPCLTTPEECEKNNDTYIGDGYAYQYDPNNDKCYLLGTEINMTIYDPDEQWARGIKVKYENGGFAGGCQTEKKNREFVINFLCPDTKRGFRWDKTYDEKDEVTIQEKISEDEGKNCGYSIDIESSLACPYQCITKDVSDPTQFSICSGKGKCALDPYAGFVRCICDDGWTGDDCLTVVVTTSMEPIIETNTKYKNHLGWLVVTIIVVIAAVLVAVIGYRYHTKTVDDLKSDYYKRQQQGTGDELLSNDTVATKKKDMELITEDLPDETQE